MKTAEQPFRFHTAAYLTRVGNQKAACLADLCDGIRSCSDASIFYHTYQCLNRLHFLTEGFSNDFAQWVLAACNRPGLAEELAAIDIREYVNLAALRGDLCRIVSAYLLGRPHEGPQAAFEPFYFLEGVQVALPLGIEVNTLEEFREALVRLSHASFHYHFIASRLRLQLGTNDFSAWLATALGLEALARAVNRIDIYTHTLESAQKTLAALLDRELRR